MLNELKIELPHTTLAALVNTTTISPSKPTLLFLHGYLDNANSFIDLIPHLKQWQCIAVDMVGHGKSAHRSADAHYHLPDYAYDLHQLITTLQLSNVVLVGHSLGAIVCSLYAATKPIELKGFIAIESCGPLAAPDSTTSEQLTACFESRHKAQSAIKNPTSMEHVIRARCSISDLSEKQARIILSRNILELDGNLRWCTDKRLRTTSVYRMTEEQANNILNNIVCPRLIILGNQGFEKVKTNIDCRKLAFQNTPLYTFNGGHHVHMNATKEVSSCIKTYSTLFFSE